MSASQVLTTIEKSSQSAWRDRQEMLCIPAGYLGDSISNCSSGIERWSVTQ